MKSDKALNRDVSAVTFCRHGFHEWLAIETEEALELELEAQEMAPSSHGKEQGPAVRYRCKHCGVEK